jgi:hypothetical protein
MSNELQKDKLYLPGNLGTVRTVETNNAHNIKSVEKRNDDSVTLTLSPAKPWCAAFIEHMQTEDADFEIIEPKQIENGK